MKNQRRYRDGIDAGILDNDKIRIVLLAFFMLVLFLVLACRAYYLQLYHGEEHRNRIATQSIRHIRIPGWRGNIYTRDRQPVAVNKTVYDLIFYPKEMRIGGRKKTIANMCKHADSIALILNRQDNKPEYKDFEKHLWHTPALPIVVFNDLSTAEIAKAFEYIRNNRGIDLQISSRRIYPQKKMAAHLTGYARYAEAEREADREDFFYYKPDTVGKAGIEEVFDTLPPTRYGVLRQQLGLRAFPGRQLVQVNNFGLAHRQLLGKVEPIHGNNVILTIDSRAQHLAEKLLGNNTGAFVVVDADTGDVLCAASTPSYDLAKFSPKLSPDYYRALLQHPEKPLINRALRGIYPPGSTLKPLVCLAFLKSGIDPAAELPCEGYVTIGKATIRCQAHRYSGADLNMETALEKSCNGYMMTNALKYGFSPMAEIMRSAGIGREAGAELPGHPGSYPYEKSVTDHDIALLSIGQGKIAVTPLQMALFTAALANGGKVFRPHLVYKVIDRADETVMERDIEVISTLDATPEALEIVRKGMFKVVNSPGGSGKQAAVEGLKIYGKTGTAELGPRNKLRHITHFIGFVKYRSRRYAAAITVEDGVSGGRSCAPLAAAFFQNYLEPDALDALDYN